MNSPLITNNQNLRLARDWVLAHPALYLKLRLVLALLALICLGIADLGSTSYAVRQRYLDAMGNFSGSYVELLCVSSVTLIAYIIIGTLWSVNRRYIAAVLYGVIVGLLVLCLWTTESGRLSEIWAAGSSNSQAALPFASQQNGSSTTDNAPFWFLLLGNTVLAVAFTLAGLAFIMFKARFVKLVEEWRHLSTANRIISAHQKLSALEKQVRQHSGLHNALKEPAKRDQLLRQARRIAIKQCRAHAQALRNSAAELLHDVAVSAEDQRQAQERVSRADRFLEALDRIPVSAAAKAGFVMTILLAFFWASSPMYAQTTAELCAQAPVFQVIADVSGSSPARDSGFINEAAPLILQKLRALPPCSTVLVVTVGDAALVPITMRTRIQLRSTKDGATVDEIAHGLQQWLSTLPKGIEDHPHGRSELIGAFSDAARNFNLHANRQNVIVMLSDLVEHSSIADCEGRTACRLPAPKFTLANADITVYGAGRGLSSSRAMALQKAWDHFFNQAGTKADMRRTF